MSVPVLFLFAVFSWVLSKHSLKLSYLLHDTFSEALQCCQALWRLVVAVGNQHPTFSAAPNLYDDYCSERLPADQVLVCFEFTEWHPGHPSLFTVKNLTIHRCAVCGTSLHFVKFPYPD
jgi:hypothetical protein